MDTGGLEERILALFPEMEIRKAGAERNRGKEETETGGGLGKRENGAEETGRRFILCRDIFMQGDYSEGDIFVDMEGRIMENEEDFFKVFNKGYSYQTFLFMQKPLFMERVRAMRKDL